MKQAWKVKIFDWGTFALDGGAMFGVVPKVLWSKLIAPDEANRIPLGLRSLYLEQGEKKVLIELGMGNDWDEKLRKIYHLESSPLETTLAAKVGVKPADITHVILSHLHFDHCGFLSVREGGQWKSAFPNAEIFVVEENFKNANSPNPRENASYLPHFWADPWKRGQITLVPVQWMELREILPGIQYRRIDGHTRGQGMIYLDATDGDLLYPGDLFPTPNHLKESYVMGYDLQPGLSVREKRIVLGEAESAARDWVFCHGQGPLKQRGSELLSPR